MSIFKESFNSNVKKSLETRQEVMGKSIRTPKELVFLNSNTSWVSLKSSVNIGEENGSDTLAKNNVLVGGTLNDGKLRYGADNEGKGAYSTKTSNGVKHVLGMRPMPGITSVEIHNKGAYGSTRIATINFQCWDVEQLNILEALYMRPGYTVLLEFGRNTYLDDSGNLKEVKPTDDFFNKKNIILIDYLNELYKRTTSSGGNYDALFGYIINYGWSARNDGGYDCKTEIVTTGEILESLKVNYTVGLVNFASTIQSIGTTPTSSSLTPPPLSPSTAGNRPKFTGLLHDPVNLANNNKFQYPYLVSYGRINEEYSKNILSGLIYETFRLCNMASMGGVFVGTNPLSPISTTVIPPDGGELKYQTSLIASTTDVINYAVIDYNSTNNIDPDYTIIKSVDKGDVFITLESFIKIINKYIMAINPSSNGHLTRLSVHDRGYLGKDDAERGVREQTPLYCLFHPLMVSVNPDAVLVKNDNWISLLSNIRIENNWVLPTEDEKGTVSGFIADPNLVTFVSDILSDLYTISDININKPLDILKKIETKAKASKLSKEDFAKLFNEHYVWLRGGFETLNRSNNTYTFSKLPLSHPAERVIKSEGAQYTKTFKNVFENHDGIGPYTLDLNNTKNYEYSKAIFDYSYSNESTVKLEAFVNNETNLSETLDKTQSAVNNSNSAASMAGKWWTENVYTKLKKDFIHVAGKQKFGTIGNIYLNTKFLYKMAKDPSLQQQDTSGKQSLLILNYLKAIMQEVQTSLGNVNNFEIIIDDRDGVGRIVDLNYINLEKENLFKFEIGSNNSIIKDIKIESEISNNMSSMIAIAAQSSAGAFGLDNSTLISYNAGILDRMIPKKDSPIYSLSGGPTIEGLKIQSFTEALSVIAKFFSAFGGNDVANPTGNFDAKNAESNKNALREIISFFSSVKNSSNKNRAFLPSRISLTIDGLAGIVIGNLFDVDKTFIPKFYKGNPQGRDLGYITVNVAHSISDNVWNTTVQGYPFIIENDRAKDDEDYDFSLIVDYDPLTNTITTSLDLIGNKKLRGSTRSLYNKAETREPGFQAKVKQVATAIGTTEETLIAVMRSESGIDSSRVNPDGGATGLIQFMPNSGKNYRYNNRTYTRDQLRSMGGIKQLDLVQSYFNDLGLRGQKQVGFFELYGATFYPLMISGNKPDNWILGSERSQKYAQAVGRQNPGIAKFSSQVIGGQRVIDVAAFKKYCAVKLSETFL